MIYYKLPFKSKSSIQLLKRAQETKIWRSYFNFDAIRVRNRELEQDKFFLNLHKFSSFKCGIIKLEPNTFYNWHTDARRKVSVNMLLGQTHSHTLFCLNFGDILGKFEEIKYEPNTCYLFNNTIHHTVINFDNPRYLFSLEFDNKNIDFNEVFNKIKEEEIRFE